MYLMQVGVLPNSGEMSDAERSLMESSPMWVTGLFAIAVFAGALGALGLLLRRRWARPLLILSLVAVVLQFGGWLLATDAIRMIGPSVFAMPAVIVAVAILLAWLATIAVRRGWLR
jgi:drug/metabolite transporter (DMT)-like permease